MTKHHCHLCVQKQKVIYMAPNSIGLCLVIAINKKNPTSFMLYKRKTVMRNDDLLVLDHR